MFTSCCTLEEKKVGLDSLFGRKEGVDWQRRQSSAQGNSRVMEKPPYPSPPHSPSGLLLSLVSASELNCT